jgi:hypothetical protein
VLTGRTNGTVCLSSSSSSPSSLVSVGGACFDQENRSPKIKLLGKIPALRRPQKAGRVFPEENKGIITERILGDASLRIHGKGVRLNIKQKNQEFVYHLNEVFQPLSIVGAEPTEVSTCLKTTGKT